MGHKEEAHTQTALTMCMSIDFVSWCACCACRVQQEGSQVPFLSGGGGGQAVSRAGSAQQDSKLVVSSHTPPPTSPLHLH